MGTKVQCKSYLPGYHSMRDLNEDSNDCSWPVSYGDKTLPNGEYYSGFLPRNAVGAYPGYDRDVVKQTMLEHEAIFRNQVFELHRLYRTQRDLMDDIKRKELLKNQITVGTTLSSPPLASQITSDGARKWHMPNFPMANSVSARPSVSGSEDNHSSFSSIKRNAAQAGSFLCQNGGSSKDIEVLQSRPTKFCRNLLDLQLPADEYIDTEEEEQSREETGYGISSYLPNGNNKDAVESGAKLHLRDVGKTGCQGDALSSDMYLRCTNGLADLNKPIQVEEADTPTYADILSHSSCHGNRSQELSAKPRSHFLGLPKEISLNFHHGSNNGKLNSLQMENNGNGGGWFPHALEAGHTKSNLKSVCRERTNGNFKISERHNEIFHYNHPESIVVPRIPIQYSVSPSPDMAKSWSHSVSSREMPSSSLSQKSISVQMHPYLNSSATLSKSSQSSTQSHGIFADRWHLNNNSRSNPGFGSEFPHQNGLNQGSSLGSKLLVSVNYDYLNCSNDNVASEKLMNHGSTTHYKGSNCLVVNSAKDVNLDVVLSNSSSNEVGPRKALEIRDRERNHEDHRSVLPWLRSQPACENEATTVVRDSYLRGSSFFESSSNDDAKRNEIGDRASNKKILGFSISGKHHPSDSEVTESNRKFTAFDINLPCDPGLPDLSEQTAAEVLVIENQTDLKSAKFRHDIDLNSCVNEDDEACLISFDPSANVNFTAEIDLEAPVVPEPEEISIPLEALAKKPKGQLQLLQQISEDQYNELAAMAAEAIVAISSLGHKDHINDTTCNQFEVSTPNSLHWFVEIVSSYGDDICEKLDNQQSPVEEVDYFESMTLELTENKAEEYMPTPLVPENLKLEESGTTLSPNRPRRGQARRGRQRRDFQRDILPGLTSLSRHEVTEDLQTFGGLMRATGHSWHSGLTRRNSTRNGCARGRRKSVVTPPPAVPTTPACTLLVQQLNYVEVGLTDRSLTGWGKTTRRPRRQRCPPAGNPPTLPST